MHNKYHLAYKCLSVCLGFMLHEFVFFPCLSLTVTRPPHLFLKKPTSQSYKLGRTRPAWQQCCYWLRPWYWAPAACHGSPGTTPSSHQCHGLESKWPDTREEEKSSSIQRIPANVMKNKQINKWPKNNIFNHKSLECLLSINLFKKFKLHSKPSDTLSLDKCINKENYLKL